MKTGSGCSWLRIVSVAGFGNDGVELSGSATRCGCLYRTVAAPSLVLSALRFSLQCELLT